MVDGKQHNPTNYVGTLGPMPCRPPLPVGSRPGGLLIRFPPISKASDLFQRFHRFEDRPVCLTGQQKVNPICVKVATLGGNSSGCPPVSPRQPRGLICKPPLVNNRKISSKISSIPKCQSFDGAPLLGFSHMVAPVNKNESSKNSLPQGHPLQGYVHQLLGGGDAPPKWDLVCLVCSGKYWRGNKFNLRPLKISLQDTTV